MPAPTTRQNGTVTENPLELASRRESAVRTVGQAISQGRLKFAYQPVVSAQNGTTIAYYEALARIENEGGTTTQAQSFIADLEHHDVCRLLDVAALRNALSVISDQRNCRIAVNLSADGVGDPAWLATLQAACARDPLCGDFLIVEITESAFLDLNAGALAFLYEIRRLGASVAIDDFGAGHTSIGHLGKFRFDFLKIDKSFLKDFTTDRNCRYLVQSMINIARHFEMVSIVEGVESIDVGHALAQMGADCLQGYAYGRPEFRHDWNGAMSAGANDAGAPAPVVATEAFM